MPPSPLHFARSGDFWGEGGVSGACEGRWPRGLRGRGLPAPKHPKGRKRRSGWDSRTDIKGWTRELAFDEWDFGWWLVLVVSAQPTAPQGLAAEREVMVRRASANLLYRPMREE